MKGVTGQKSLDGDCNGAKDWKDRVDSNGDSEVSVLGSC